MKKVLTKYIFIFLAFLLITFFIFQINGSYLSAGVYKNNNKNPENVASDIKVPEEASTDIAKKTIVIDPGHGGIDPGTSKDGLVEKEVTLDVAKKLQSYLEQLGYNVFLTRDSDTTNYNPTNVLGSRVRKDLDGRISFAKEKNAMLFVSIHVDSLPEDSSQTGSIAYYYPTLPQSKDYAQSIQDALNSIQVDNGSRSKNNIRTENFYVIKNSVMPSVLIEAGFITNTLDHKLLSQESFRDQLAKSISMGINKLN